MKLTTPSHPGHRLKTPPPWTAVARQQPRHRFWTKEVIPTGEIIRICENGVALPFPPQSKTRLAIRLPALAAAADLFWEPPSVTRSP